MLFLQAHPLGPPLEEAEVTARSRAPRIVLGCANSTLLKDTEDIVLPDANLFERVQWSDVGLSRDVALTSLVRSYSDIQEYRIISHVGFERFDLQLLRAPAHVGRGQVATIDLKPVVKPSFAQPR